MRCSLNMQNTKYNLSSARADDVFPHSSVKRFVSEAGASKTSGLEGTCDFYDLKFSERFPSARASNSVHGKQKQNGKAYGKCDREQK